MTYNAMTERYEEITVCGKPALFTSIRIKRDTVPDCRISTAKQSTDRQVRNIKAEYPTAHIVQEAYTGTSIFRPEWLKLYRVLKAGDPETSRWAHAQVQNAG